MEIFSGHLEQVDYQDGVIRGLHLVDRDGVRWLVRLDPPTQPLAHWAPISANDPIVYLALEARPPVTIEREGP